jgi:fatty-acyl-CoA synthase
VSARKRDVIVVSGYDVNPTDVEKLAEAIAGVRRGSAAAVSLTNCQEDDAVAIVVESPCWSDEPCVRQIRGNIDREVSRRFGIAAAMILIVEPGMVPKTASGELERSLIRKLLPSQ